MSTHSIKASVSILILLCASQALPVEIEDIDIATENRIFAYDLYQRLAQNQGNIFFSPYSISTALAMTYAGARTITEEEMATVLHFPGDQEVFHPAFSELLRNINAAAQGDGIGLHVANSMWFQDGYHFLPEFMKTTSEHYRAAPFLVDFANNTEEARIKINDWVSDHTADLINDLIRPGILTPLVRLVLCNAIHFKGSWATSFDESYTRDEAFHIDDKQSVTIPMMWVKSDFKHLDSEGFDMLELPYSGGQFSMVIVLPDKVNGSSSDLQMTSEKMEVLLDDLSDIPSTLVSVKVPRFSMTQSFELADTLSNMGMPHAFHGADFSGMTGDLDLFISNVIHKAFLDVTEEGTEAAAATAVVLKRGPRPTQFICDHPFMFMIREASTGSILFMGRLMNPLA